MTGPFCVHAVSPVVHTAGQTKLHLLLHAAQPREHILRLSGKGPRFLALREEVVELLQRPARDLQRACILQCSNEQYTSVCSWADEAQAVQQRSSQLRWVSACTLREMRYALTALNMECMMQSSLRG